MCGLASEDEVGRLIYLSGQQDPEWLNILGARLSLDAEFYRRHISGAVGIEAEEFDAASILATPFLPAAFTEMVRIPLMTVGTYRSSSAQVRPSSLRNGSHRRQAALRLRHGLENYHTTERLDDGNSLLRALNVHNRRFFSLEQSISVHIGGKNGRFVSKFAVHKPCSDLRLTSDQVIVWSDVAHGISRAALAEALCSQKDNYDVHLLPVLQHSHNMAQKRNVHSKPLDGSQDELMVQNGLLLAMNFGHLFKETGSSKDVLSILTELLRFTASAEEQFLTMMAQCLRLDLEPTTPREGTNTLKWGRDAQSNLEYNRRLLTPHIHQMEQICSFIQSRLDQEWTPAASEQGSTSTTQPSKDGKRLLKDYTALLERAKSLAADFESGMSMLMNTAMIAESQKAIEQAKRVTKLTSLAFFFIPLSFSSSMFGMNFKEFADANGNRLHIWIWVVVSVALLLVAYIFLQWDNIQRFMIRLLTVQTPKVQSTALKEEV